MKRGLDRSRQRADRERLGQPRNPLQQDVAIRQQADQQPIHQLLLPYNDLANFPTQLVDPDRRRLHLLTQRCTHYPTNLGKERLGHKLSAASDGCCGIFEVAGGAKCRLPTRAALLSLSAIISPTLSFSVVSCRSF